MRKTARSDFGSRLYEARTGAKLTQKQLAKAAGLSQSTLAELEVRGQGSARTLQLAAACGVSPQWLSDNIGPKVLEGPAKAEPPGYSTEALALAWLLDQIPSRIDKVRANSAATAAILSVLQQLDAAPTHTPAGNDSPAKRPA